MIFNWRQSTEQSALLRKIVDRIRNSLELKVVLQTAVDEVAALLNLDCCIFFWHFDDTARIQIICERTSSPEQSTLLGYYSLESLGSVAAAIPQGSLIISGDVLDSPILKSMTRRLARLTEPHPPHFVGQLLGSHANLLVPVKTQAGSMGYLGCLAHQPRHWSTGEIEFTQSLAQQLEIAIQQAQLYEQTQRQAQREQLVNQITTLTRQSFELETILTQAIAQLLEALQADRCIVHLVEEESLASASSSSGLDANQNAAFRRKHLYEICREPFPTTIDDFDTHGPMTSWVIENCQSVIISDVTQDPRIGSDNEEYQKAQIKSSLVVPAQANGVLHAILYLNQCSHPRYWSINDQKLAQAIADQLAISIQQAHLYAQTQQQAIESAAQAEHLAEAIQELRLTQAQLVQSEKMSSLGQLVAGVAHEINNPIAFIYGNLPYIETHLQDMTRLLLAYQSSYPQPSAEIQTILEDVELEFLMKDSLHILSSIRSGAERIREIVLSLRNFSRLDEASRKTVDLHEGLESTILVLQNQLQGVQILRHYRELPRVDCYPRLLNQVFMSVLINAIEALESSPVSPKIITIRTEVVTGAVVGEYAVQIAIADNGPGIPTDILHKIFDPFFTTKPVGKGAGLGLAVSYQTVINQHRGTFVCNSDPGEGAEFIIQIPVKYPKRMDRGTAQ